MDRWEGADDGIAHRKHEPKGKVAALGIDGFVRGAVEGGEKAQFGPVEVLASKKVSGALAGVAGRWRSSLHLR